MAVETNKASGGEPFFRSHARYLVIAAVFLSFTLDSFARYPIPGPNESHYLCKAKHYWDPEWCARDLFLASSNAHLVFYQTFGLPTRWLSVATTALIGRLVGLWILAVGWTALVNVLVPARWPALWAAWVFLALSALGSLSGEWLVGGIEAKVVAYGLLFSAIAAAIEGQADGNGRRILWAGILAGLAISFHPVVGIWGVASAVFATLVRAVFRGSRTPGRRVGGRWYAGSAAALGLLAVPGIVAGLRAASGSSVVADYIQVYYRLAHHLDPLHFAEWGWIGDGLNWLLALVHLPPLDFTGWPWVAYGLLACCWLVGRRWMSRRDAERWFFWFVVGSGLIALGGFLVGWRSGPPEHVQNYLIPWKGLDYPWRWKLLKLYPFRLFDGLLPIAVAITVAGLCRHWCEHACKVAQSQGRSRRTVIWIWLVCGVPALVACLFRAPDARSPFTPTERADWLDACNWVEHNTPADALILTPTQQTWAFKWYAQRAEYVSYKDCPQDGPGIVDWNNRLLYLADWTASHAETGFTVADMAPLRARGISYIVDLGLGTFHFPPVYHNGTFRVYRIDELPPPKS
jgi:uncharacterized protein DUF6798